jgi:UDPglucose--hexose-1-phosphate uridylyltransferase
VVFCPYASKYPFNVWIIPKEHHSDFLSISEAQLSSLAQMTKNIYSKLGIVLDNCSISLILHTAPIKNRNISHYHWYFELIPELIVSGNIDKGTGLFINPLFPEEAAKILAECSDSK